MALTWADNFDAVVREHIEPGVIDNFFRDTPVMTELRQTAKAVTGDKIQEILEYAEQGAVGIADKAQLTATDTEIVTRAEFDWYHMYADARLSKFEINAGSGPEAVADMIRVKTQNAIKSLRRLMSTKIFTDQATTYPDSLTDACNDTTPYGDIATGDMSQWIAHVMDDDVDTNGWIAPSIANIKKMVRYIHDTCGEKPHLIVVHPEYYNVLDAEVSENDRLAGIRNSNVVMMGFDAIAANGVPIVSDLDCPGSAFSGGSRGDGYEALFINWNAVGLRYMQAKVQNVVAFGERYDFHDFLASFVGVELVTIGKKSNGSV